VVYVEAVEDRVELGVIVHIGVPVRGNARQGVLDEKTTFLSVNYSVVVLVIHIPNLVYYFFNNSVDTVEEPLLTLLGRRSLSNLGAVTGAAFGILDVLFFVVEH